MKQICTPIALLRLCQDTLSLPITNNDLHPAELQRELTQGTLWGERTSKSVLLWRRRENYDRMHYMLAEPVLTAALPARVGTEHYFLPQQEAEPPSFLLQNGFQSQFFRQRMVHVPTVPTPAPTDAVRPARQSELDRVMQLLRSGFDPITGWLPTAPILSQDIACGNVLCLVQKSEVVGAVHFYATEESCDIRHVVIDPSCRGKGLGTALIRGFLAAPDVRGKQVRVWARTDSPAALGLYRACGFAPDGYRSAVMLRGFF